MNNKVILFVNGEAPIIAPDLTLYHKIYCTDGAYNYLEQLGIQPDVISGDFDSFYPNLNSSDINIIHTPDQNFTDFEKALNIIINDGYLAVDVFGASGKEQDHYLGNLNAALKFKKNIRIRFYDNYSCYYFLDYQQEIKTIIGQKISLIPFPNAKGIKTNGLKYPLKNEDLQLIDRIGTRNEAIFENISIEFIDGNLLIFLIHT